MPFPWSAGEEVTASDLNRAISQTVTLGGTGADGALAISSGTTNIDLGNAKIVVKNYTSISITGTGKLTFTNPHATGTIIILKSQGNVDLTSSQTPMIDASKLGCAGGAARDVTSGNWAGVDGADGIGKLFKTHGGLAGPNSGASGGVGGAVTGASDIAAFIYEKYERYSELWVGGGGGSGNADDSTATGATTSGRGGIGGACLVIECAGYWNFTTANGISVAGENGQDASRSGTSAAAGGGGGGAGGFFLGLYKLLTANSGTVNVAGGTGGNCNIHNGYTARGGGGGASATSAGSTGTTSTSSGTKTGGDGASGVSLIQKV